MEVRGPSLLDTLPEVELFCEAGVPVIEASADRDPPTEESLLTNCPDNRYLARTAPDTVDCWLVSVPDTDTIISPDPEEVLSCEEAVPVILVVVDIEPVDELVPDTDPDSGVSVLIDPVVLDCPDTEPETVTVVEIEPATPAS